MTFVVQGVDVRRFLSLHRNAGDFWVRVRYTDVNNSQLVTARFHLTAMPDDSEVQLFHKAAYTHEGDAAPFASVVFDAAIASLD